MQEYPAGGVERAKIHAIQISLSADILMVAQQQAQRANKTHRAETCHPQGDVSPRLAGFYARLRGHLISHYSLFVES